MTTNAPYPEADTLWDARDVAAYLKVSRSWVYGKAERGDLPSFHVGGLLRFDPAVVKAWVRKGSQPARVVSFSKRQHGR